MRYLTVFENDRLRELFRLVMVADQEDGGGAAVEDSAAEKVEQKKHENGFPADTPLAEMSDKEQAAYWKFQSRKHERNRKPDNFDEIVEQARKFREHERESKPEQERALDDARSAGRVEGIHVMLHDAVRAEFKARRPSMTNEALDEFLSDLALEKFLTDDQRIDIEKVDRMADKLATAPEDDDKSSTDTRFTLGRVLGSTQERPRNSAGSVESSRQQELARYKRS